MPSISPWYYIGITLSAVSIIVTTISIALSVRLILKQRRTKRLLKQSKLRNQMEIARQCLNAAKLTAIEIATLAVEAGMTPIDVYRDYLTDVPLRKEIILRILGENDSKLAKKLIDNFPSRFLSNGYLLQADFAPAMPPGLKPYTGHESLVLPVLPMTPPGISLGEKKLDKTQRSFPIMPPK